MNTSRESPVSVLDLGIFVFVLFFFDLALQEQSSVLSDFTRS